MATIVQRRIDDPQLFERAVRAANVIDYTVVQRGHFKANLLKADFRRLWYQRGEESLGRLADVAIDPCRRPIFFLADARQAEMQQGGRTVSTRDVVLFGASETFLQRTTAACAWASLSLTPQDFDDASRLIADRDLADSVGAAMLRPTEAALARLRWLHGEIARLGEDPAGMLTHPAVADALEHELLLALLATLGAGGDRAAPLRGWQQHGRILDAFGAWLAEHGDTPAHLLDICRALDVPSRTLRLVCQEHFGMGPIRYLWLRRMHLAHRALGERPRGTTTVTGVATEFGFWQFGRFAVQYRTLFGESPSATLARSQRPS